MSHTVEKPCRSGLTLNFGQAGESAKKRVKMQNYIQETPELAKLFTDPVPTKFYSPLQTPDLAKIGISTPELERLAFGATLNLRSVLPTPTTFPSSTLAGALPSAPTSCAPASAALPSSGGTNSVTLVNLPGNHLDTDDDALRARKRLRSQEEIRHANNLINFSSQDSVSSTDSHNPLLHNSGGEQILPIDMDNQELIKQNRKRERNRIAASRCRQRKLEKISTLQDDVNLLQEKNEKLQKYIEYVEELIHRRENTVCAHLRFNCEY